MIKRSESFKDRLEKALEKRQMKPVDLAQKTGLSQATISQYRSGYAVPKIDRTAVIAAALNVNPAWLMGIDVPEDVTLTDEEAELLEAFRRAPEGRREAVRALLEIG